MFREKEYFYVFIHHRPLVRRVSALHNVNTAPNGHCSGHREALLLLLAIRSNGDQSSSNNTTRRSGGDWCDGKDLYVLNRAAKSAEVLDRRGRRRSGRGRGCGRRG